MFCPMNIIHRFRLPHRAAESDYLRYKVLIFYRTEYIPYLEGSGCTTTTLATRHCHCQYLEGKNKEYLLGGSPTSGFTGRYKYVGKLMVYNSSSNFPTPVAHSVHICHNDAGQLQSLKLAPVQTIITLDHMTPSFSFSLIIIIIFFFFYKVLPYTCTL